MGASMSVSCCRTKDSTDFERSRCTAVDWSSTVCCTGPRRQTPRSGSKRRRLMEVLRTGDAEAVARAVEDHISSTGRMIVDKMPRVAMPEDARRRLDAGGRAEATARRFTSRSDATYRHDDEARRCCLT